MLVQRSPIKDTGLERVAMRFADVNTAQCGQVASMMPPVPCPGRCPSDCSCSRSARPRSSIVRVAPVSRTNKNGPCPLTVTGINSKPPSSAARRAATVVRTHCHSTNGRRAGLCDERAFFQIAVAFTRQGPLEPFLHDARSCDAFVDFRDAPFDCGSAIRSSEAPNRHAATPVKAQQFNSMNGDGVVVAHATRTARHRQNTGGLVIAYGGSRNA